MAGCSTLNISDGGSVSQHELSDSAGGQNGKDQCVNIRNDIDDDYDANNDDVNHNDNYKNDHHC